jgi:methylated-DNA-[protein]-cysteine S-methyltransferase
MSDYSSSFYCQEGPDILTRFYVSQGEICRVDLSVNTQTGTAWQIFTDGSLNALEGQICQWMETYLQKKTPKGSLPLSLRVFPPFTSQVFTFLQKIPFGEKYTYQQVAEKLGSPLASRAVGNACGRNFFPLIIPCHRIIASNLGIGGFSLGLEIKKSLLAFEGFNQF